MQDIAAPRDTPSRNLHDVGGKRAKDRRDVLQSPVLSYNRPLARAPLLHEWPILLGLSLGKVYPSRLLAFSSSSTSLLSEPFFLICCQRVSAPYTASHRCRIIARPAFQSPAPIFPRRYARNKEVAFARCTSLCARPRGCVAEIDCSTGLIVGFR